MKNEILSILAELVACDTQNPPRAIAVDGEIFQAIRGRLGADFEFTTKDFGKGRVNLLASRGKPQRLFNVHLDTVPIGDATWTRPPIQLTIENEKAFGRGVCDIKGAAACLISAAKSTENDVAILFSTDEEGSESCCVHEFCVSDLASSFNEFIVAEPTGCQAVAGHRGYLSVRMHFTGTARHTSQHQHLADSANHRAVQWTSEALARVKKFQEEVLGGHSACFNVGRIDGGIKNNMIAEQCVVTWSARMPAGFANHLLLDRIFDACPEYISWEITFDGAPLPTNQNQRQETLELCRSLSLPVADDVDFWTEAAIFASTNKPTFVLGPGDIAQAHSVDEWVAVEQLESCAAIYAKLMTG